MTDAVVASDLSVTYGAKVALSPSSFSIPAGRVTAVIGPNGSGKSTLLNVIAGLTEPDSGTIDITDVAGRPRRISYVLQATRVNEALPVTVGEIVAMGRYASTGAYRRLGGNDRDAVREAMHRMDIDDLATAHLRELSGGQRQRVFVAQGLAQDHDMLLLDEPLTGIDITTAQSIDAVIHDETSRGCTVIMTTHDLSEAQFSDHVLLVARRVVASGPPGEVLTAERLQAAYGAALLHPDDTGPLFLDDPHHTTMPGRHAHRERVIHTEVSPLDQHVDPG